MADESFYYFNPTPFLVAPNNFVFSDDLNNPLKSIGEGMNRMVSDIRNGSNLSYAPDTGDANEYVISPDPPLTEYSEGMFLWLKALNGNTGPSTIKANDLDPVPILKIGHFPLSAGDITANYFTGLKYTDGAFQITTQSSDSMQDAINAENAKIAAEDAKALSESARDASIAAKVGAEAARDVAVSAKNTALTSESNASTSEDNAQAYAEAAAADAASINLPAIGPGDGGKTLEVLPDGDGYELISGTPRDIVGDGNVSVDNSDPKHPVISSSAGVVDSVASGTDISIDSSDPANPVVSFSGIINLPRVSEVLTGGIQGLSYEYTSPSTVTFKKGNCWDSTGTTILQLNSDTVLTIPADVDGKISLFLCDDDTLRTDTNTAGSNLTSYKKRWVGYVPTDSAGDVIPFDFVDGILFFRELTKTIVVSANIPTAFTQVSLATIAPIDRIGLCELGVGSYTDQPRIAISINGTDTIGSLGGSGAGVEFISSPFRHNWFVRASSSSYDNNNLSVVFVTLLR